MKIGATGAEFPAFFEKRKAGFAFGARKFVGCLLAWNGKVEVTLEKLRPLWSLIWDAHLNE